MEWFEGELSQELTPGPWFISVGWVGKDRFRTVLPAKGAGQSRDWRLSSVPVRPASLFRCRGGCWRRGGSAKRVWWETAQPPEAPLAGPCFVSSGEWLAAGVLLCQTGTRIPIPWGRPGDSKRLSMCHSVGNRNSNCWRRALLRTQKKPHGRQKVQWYRLGLWEKGAEHGFEVGGHLSQEAAASATLGGLGWDRVGL